MSQPAATAPARSRIARRRALTLGLLAISYAGYYLCRSNLPALRGGIEYDLVEGGLSPEAARIGIGRILSVGTLAYAAGKFVGGGAADLFGGRRGLLLGMAGAVAFTLMFAGVSSLNLFILAWTGNRFLQAFGWPGLVKIASRWVPASSYGSAMGALSLSYLFGDGVARALIGLLSLAGLDWRGIFVAAAATVAALFVVDLFLLAESPTATDDGPEPLPAPGNLYGESGDDPRAPGLVALLGPLLSSPTFGVVCLLSLGLTILREAFNNWTPTYFAEGVGLGEGAAALTSAIFPMAGGISVLLFGALSDRLGSGGRAWALAIGPGAAGLALAGLAMLGDGGRAGWIAATVLVGAAGFLLIGPYSLLAGAIALDLGGKRGSGSASGLIDGVGYLGGVLSGEGLARLVLAGGWPFTFATLAAIAWASGALAMAWCFGQRRRGIRVPGDRP